jgi:hypothetical protein
MNRAGAAHPINSTKRRTCDIQSRIDSMLGVASAQTGGAKAKTDSADTEGLVTFTSHVAKGTFVRYGFVGTAARASKDRNHGSVDARRMAIARQPGGRRLP